jgi:hypothetical protein
MAPACLWIEPIPWDDEPPTTELELGPCWPSSDSYVWQGESAKEFSCEVTRGACADAPTYAWFLEGEYLDGGQSEGTIVQYVLSSTKLEQVGRTYVLRVEVEDCETADAHTWEIVR